MFKSFLCVVIVSLMCTVPSASANLQHRSTSIDNVIDRAHELLGTPYKAGGSSTERGFDCSSFLVYLFKTEANIQLPRTTSGMHRSTAKTVKRDALKPGDAVFFRVTGVAASAMLACISARASSSIRRVPASVCALIR